MQRTFGIDVSYHQGVIDWAKVKAAGVNFAILRGGYGVGNVDTQFVNNITGAIAAGIKNIGVYWFSYAYNAMRARAEVNLCLRTIEPYREYINLPVWFDFEGASYTYVQETQGVSLTAAQIQTIARAWCNAVVSGGYTTGIYSNKADGEKWFKLSSGKYLWHDLNCEFWYARYGANDETSLFIVPDYETTALQEHPETNIFQYSDVGRVTGINARVDLNVRYVEETTEDEDETGDEPDEPTPVEPIPSEPPFIPQVETVRPKIEYVEVRGDDTEIIGIVDIAKSVIWHSVFFGVGDFEIYAPATPELIYLLQEDRYITRPDNNEVGIIERIVVAENLQDGAMITASGRFGKSILDRRIIYNLSGVSNKATILSGNVESAVRTVVKNNAIACAFDSKRNIALLELGALSSIPLIIVDDNGKAAEKQVSYENLLTYTDGVLEEYGLSAICIIDGGKLRYTIYTGEDRSVDNTDGNTPIIFSQEYDNLTASEYTYDATTEKNAALIGGEGEGVDRFYSMLARSEADLQRREIFIDASSISKKYKDDSDVEQTYTDAQYKSMLDAKGKQDLAPLVASETFNGTIDITNGSFIYGRDFTLGDIVTVENINIGKYANVRIREVLEVQDGNGYTVEATYQ